jgi:hypothetical protein
MNRNAYLSKIISQERIFAKIQLVKEHAELCKLELKEETEQADTTWSNPKVGKSKEAEFLKKLGATEHKMGPNPVTYELVTDIDETRKDKFRFYSDGSVYSYNLSRTLGWAYDDGQIKLINFTPNAIIKIADEKVLATISGPPAKFVNISLLDSEEAEEKPADFMGIDGDVMDTIQTVLDFAGLVPVIGDAIDAINAIIYFARGKYFDGFLSCLAIIPVVGSALKLSIKGIYKGTRLAKLSKLIKGAWKAKSFKKVEILRALYKDLLDSKAISPTQLQMIADGMVDIERVLRRGKSGLRFIPGNTKPVGDFIDNGADFMKANGMAIDEINMASKAALDAEKASVKNISTLTPAELSNTMKGKSLPKKVFNALTLGVIPRIKAASFFPTKRLNAITAATETRFLNKMNKPGQLAMLHKFMPNPTALAPKINKRIESFLKDAPDALRTELTSKLTQLNPSAINRNGFVNFNKLSASDIEELAKWGNKNASYKPLIDDISRTMTTHTKNQGGVLWNVYKHDEYNKLLSSQTAMMINTSFAKNADIIWNEIQDVSEDLGIKSRDDVNGVIWPLTKTVMAQALGDTWTDLKDTGQQLADVVKLYGAGPVNTALTAIGVEPGQFSDYEVAQDDYTYGATVK